MVRRHTIIVFVLFVLLTGITAASADYPDHPLIIELCPNTYLRGESDEYVVIYNPTGLDIDLSGFSLRDNYDEIVFFEHIYLHFSIYGFFLCVCR